MNATLSGTIDCGLNKTPAKRVPRHMPTKSTEKNQEVVTLVIDTGGTGIKMMALDSSGKPLTERVRVPTPAPATTAAVLAEFDKLKEQMPAFDRVSVGFPGVIKRG